MVNQISENASLAAPLSGTARIKQKLLSVFREYRYLILAFIVPVVIMYLVYLAMEIHPFGNGSVLVLDLNGQYVDFYEALRRFVYGDASVLYSFSRGLGGEFMGIYAYYLASPLSYIVALFPQEHILNALLCIFLIKTGLCGASFGFYLHKTSSMKKSFSRVNVVTFSIMYALCAYCVVQQHNSMWIDAVIWLPLITYGIEELIKKGHYKLFTIALAVSVMSNFYIGWMTCIYVAAYFFVYYFMHNEDRRNNPLGERAHFAKSFLRIGIFSLLAMAISAVVLMTAYYSLTFGKTTFSTTNWALTMRYDILDMMVKFLPSSYDTVRPEGLPFVYCGALVLLLVPVYFCSSRFSMREKILSGVLIAFFLLSFAVSPVDIVWHGFQKPNWLNYRYSFMLSFFLLTLAYKAITELKRANEKILIFTSAFILLFVALAQKFEFSTFVLGDTSNDRNHEVGKLLTMECVWLTIILVAAYLVILCVMRRTKLRQNISLILVLVVSVEMFCNGLSNCLDLGSDVVYTSYSTYTDYITKLRSIVTATKNGDPSFYRMDEITHRKVNDNMAVGAFGLTNSTSTLNKTTIEYLRNMGYIALSHESRYTGGNVVSDSLLAMKYVLAKTTDSGTDNRNIKELLADPTFYSEFVSDGAYTAFLNEYALSLAYAVNPTIAEIDMLDYANPYDRLNAIITAMLGEEETVEVFKPIGDLTVNQSNCSVGSGSPTSTSNYKRPYISYLKRQSDTSATVSYTFNIPYVDTPEELRTSAPVTDDEYYEDEDYIDDDRESDPSAETYKQYIYFYLPSEFQRAFTLMTPEGSFGSCFGGGTMRTILLGSYEENRAITVTLTLESDSLYVTDGVGIFYYLDEALFADVFGRLAESQLAIDNDSTDEHLTGTITTNSDNKTIFTSIPYDKGWIVKVDGKRVDTYGILGEDTESEEYEGALVAFDIADAGEHRVELIYRPKAFTIGLTLTIIGSLILLALIIFDKKINQFLAKRFFPLTIQAPEPSELPSLCDGGTESPECGTVDRVCKELTEAPQATDAENDTDCENNDDSEDKQN